MTYDSCSAGRIEMVVKFADNRNPNSLASRLRAERNKWFRSLISTLPRPLTLLDVGGTETVWETIGFANQPSVQITLINLEFMRNVTQ